jgi:anti-sigma regulatory factor (Ser/Thr protein kinase)
MQVSLEVPVEAEAAAIAREVVARTLMHVSVPEDRIEDLRLLTSEIVTNAVRHARLAQEDTIGVAVDVSERRVRVEVADDGPGFDPANLPEPSSERVGGWGLRLVRQLSDRWGVIRNEPNLVWFEVSFWTEARSSTEPPRFGDFPQG